ncbi:MAG: hypothetical protein ABIC19_03845 [Patescibacteria group bacterium]|nr:hypothetical protein [Patescibacteria group bacterium]
MFGIKKELQKIVNAKGIQDQLNAYLVCKNAKNIVMEICGRYPHKPKIKKYLKHTQTLEIELPHIVVGQTIRVRQEEIIEKINQKMKGEYLKKIRYKIR